MKAFVIATHCDYPNGMASSRRVEGLCSALEVVGYDSSIYLLNSLHNSNHTSKGNGRAKAYCTFKTMGSFCRFTLVRYLSHFFDVARSVARMRKSGGSVCFIYTRDWFTLLMLKIFFRGSRVDLVLDVCEWPLAVMANNRTSFVQMMRAVLFVHLGLKSFSAFTCITDRLSRNVREYAPIAGRVIRVGPLYEPRYFDRKRVAVRSDKIVYVGDLIYRAQTNSVVRMFKELHGRKPRMRLTFHVGSCSGENLRQLEKKIESYGLRDFVEIIGFVEYEDLLDSISEAVLAIVPLECNDQNLCRYPNKIAEFLMCGTIVASDLIGDLRELNGSKLVLDLSGKSEREKADLIVSRIAMQPIVDDDSERRKLADKFSATNWSKPIGKLLNTLKTK